MNINNIKGFNVYRNDKFVTFIETRSLPVCKRWIKTSSAIIGTHMGEWTRTLTIRPENVNKTCFEFEYSTTVGAYFRFCPALRVIE